MLCANFSIEPASCTHHNLATYALQRDDTIRAQFVADVSLYQRETLLFIDETGTDNRDTIRKYRYSLRGKPLKAQKLLVRGEHLSCMVAMSIEGIVRGTKSCQRKCGW